MQEKLVELWVVANDTQAAGTVTNQTLKEAAKKIVNFFNTELRDISNNFASYVCFVSFLLFFSYSMFRASFLISYYLHIACENINLSSVFPF